MAQVQRRPPPAELHESQRSWQTFNFSGLSGSVRKSFSEKVPSWGAEFGGENERKEKKKQKPTLNLRDLWRNIALTSNSPSDNGFGRKKKKKNSPSGVKESVVVTQVWRTVLHLLIQQWHSTSKVNTGEARRRFTSICKNQVGQVSIARCLATADHHFSENRTTAKCVTVEMFVEPG